MTRYFYTDPLAAAWMAKHFRTLFCDRSGHMWPLINFAGNNCYPHSDALQALPERYYIHPDSLHLLEPQTDDLIQVNYNRRVIFFQPSSDIRSGIRQIIQRNGLAFMWPESEAV